MSVIEDSSTEPTELAEAGDESGRTKPSIVPDIGVIHDGAVANNYDPLPVDIVTGEGAWVTGSDGRRYLDLLAGYSALNFGHRHPRLIAVAKEQLDRLTLTSRAFSNDQLPRASEAVAALAGKECVLFMNTGAEAVESAIKVARRWGERVKGVAPGRGRIVTFAGNFHGRTTTIIGFSTDSSARAGFGPFTPGFDTVPFGDIDATTNAIGEDTVAVLVEPIQGEAGVVIPPENFLPGLRKVCDERGALLIADEIQSGLGRTGKTFACSHWGVEPDLYLLGKALGGGIMPISAVVGDWSILGVLDPGSHGSTFGGNPLACAVATEVVAMLETGEWQEKADSVGGILRARLGQLPYAQIEGFRSIGLWAGIDLDPLGPDAHAVCQALADRGALAKDTHGHTVRLSPPLVITPDEVEWAIEQLAATITSVDQR